MYTDLTMTYNDVPYLTEVQSITNAEAPKTSRAAIVESVMGDLKVAAGALPVKASMQGRITKDAALAALGRIAQNFYVMRYAEVLLSLAEAYIEKNSNLTEAVSLIDMVRARAGMPSVESVEGSNLSQSALREIVRHERRVELAFEGLRLFDLYRWKQLKDAVDRVNAEASTYNFWYEYRNYRGEQEYVWPIPQTELDCNSQLEQHSLWK